MTGPPPPGARPAPTQAEIRAQQEGQREARRAQEQYVERLRRALKAGKLAVCVGSGVTLYSIPGDERRRMGWLGLVENGLQFVQDQAEPIADEQRRDMDHARDILRRNDISDLDMFDAITRMTRVMSKRADLFPTWLRHQFESLYDVSINRGILDSIRQLHRNGAMLLTTNYDDLLERHCGLPAVSRSDPNGMLAYQRKSLDAVFHPHGHWKDPDTVVLSAKDYYNVTAHSGVQETMRALLDTKTILFVGCGGGLADPNVGELLKWVGEKHAKRGAGHYILLSLPERNPVPHLSLNQVKCRDFDDIAPWLMRLVEEGEQHEGTIFEYEGNTQRMNLHEWLSPIDQSDFVQYHSDIHRGLVPFHQSITGREEFWTVGSSEYSWVRGGRGVGKTMFCTSVIERTRQDCRLEDGQQSRDSLGYFYCSTFDPYNNDGLQPKYDFGTFCRTVIDQLCPPDKVYPVLRELYSRCTRYHPARSPTNSELRGALIEIIVQLDQGVVKASGERMIPGETYLIIDGVDMIPNQMRDDYLEFFRAIRTRNLQHLHVLVSGEREARLEQWLTVWGEWTPIDCDLIQIRPVIREFVLSSVTNDPQLYGLSQGHLAHLGGWLADRLAYSGRSFRWAYWKLQFIKGLPQLDQASIDREIMEQLGI